MSISNISEIQINITSINGKTIDLTKIFVEIEIFESIFSNFIHGKLILLDTMDLISNFPLIGNELIEVIISSNQLDSPLILNFRNYKIDRDSGIQQNNKKTKILCLYFCSEEQINSYKKSISRRFNQSSEITAQWLLENVLESSKTLEYKKSLESLELFSNYWNFNRIIQYLCENSKTSLYYDYMFFENFNNFIFKPLSELLSEDSVQDLEYNVSPKSFIKTNNIRKYIFNSFFDILSLLKVGFFGSTKFNFDELNYEFTKTESDLLENENNIMSLGNYSFFDSSLRDNTNSVDYVKRNHDINNYRSTLLKMLSQYNLITKMYGDFNRKVGLNVNFSFPNIDNEEPINKQFDGKWFITEIKHIINQNNIYEQNLLLVKNASFNNPDLTQINTLKNI